MRIFHYRQVIVRDERGQVVLNWRRLFFGRLVVKREQGKLVIKKSFLFWSQTNYPADTQSVEVRGFE